MDIYFTQGSMLPLPAYGVIILLAFASHSPAVQLPDIDSEPSGQWRCTAIYVDFP